MFSRSTLLSTIKDVVKQGGSTAPALSPIVTRSLYRSLFREVSRLDADPLAKILFPCTPDLQEWIGLSRMLYVPNSKSYVEALRHAFRDLSRAPNINLAFSTLNRLRVHQENVKSKLPLILKDRKSVLESLAKEAPKQKKLFRAEPLIKTDEVCSAACYVPAKPNAPGRVVLRAQPEMELKEGTVLVAHPLSSTHIDRRVLMITERTPFMTSGVVLDLQYGFPLSKGNTMFPEVFWGHDVYDGGFHQIGFTMPPTAQIVLLHTLEPPKEPSEDTASSRGSWLSWRQSSVPAEKQLALKRQHEVFCRPLIHGSVLDNGEKEPTLYISKAEALPYLAEIAAGQPRSALRIYWGNMRWPTGQVEAEVSNGHWIPVKVSPSFFRSYELSTSTAPPERLPSGEELREARRLREKRYGADITFPQVFPAEQVVRQREFLWDEIMYALGEEYAALVGILNPFVMGSASRSFPRIVSLLPTSPARRHSSASAHETLEPTFDDVDDDLNVSPFALQDGDDSSFQTKPHAEAPKASSSGKKKTQDSSLPPYDKKDKDKD
ncbi:unnamed protein product [Phytomonas sp. EM1]|nr:unnamed protein product [Phytomonas sp. EM1]|eukprot:CCW62231.1 unnamed protein product [Phytomonas sp. isolate EM1]